MEQKSTDQLVQEIWNYHLMHHVLEKAEVMLVLGSHDLRVPEYAAELYVKGLAPFVVISGGIAHTNDLLNTGWKESEAEKFAEVMIAHGVPSDNIILEKNATNTGQNFSLSKPIIEKKIGTIRNALVVTKPYMERRAYATGRLQWPDAMLIVTSPQMSFEEYVRGEIPKDDVINLLVGDVQRMDVYGTRGLQVPQDISESVQEAFEELKKRGYTKHLIRDV